MKTFSKALVAAAVLGTSVATQAELSANVGLVSDYYFRGIDQASSATASAGLDYESNGFYIGTWTADVNDGLEIDGYLGYGLDIGEISVGVGFTTYQYTGDFDSEYNEFNFTAGFGPLSLEYTVGEQDEDNSIGIDGGDYDFVALTYENNGFYGTYGSFGDDFDGDYIELGYGTTISEIDFGIALVVSDEELVANSDERDESLVFSMSKTFDL